MGARKGGVLQALPDSAKGAGCREKMEPDRHASGVKGGGGLHKENPANSAEYGYGNDLPLISVEGFGKIVGAPGQCGRHHDKPTIKRQKTPFRQSDKLPDTNAFGKGGGRESAFFLLKLYPDPGISHQTHQAKRKP